MPGEVTKALRRYGKPRQELVTRNRNSQLLQVSAATSEKLESGILDIYIASDIFRCFPRGRFHRVFKMNTCLSIVKSLSQIAV